ncbi:MAG: hypothetical protein ABH832_03765 [bacterium]
MYKIFAVLFFIFGFVVAPQAMANPGATAPAAAPANTFETKMLDELARQIAELKSKIGTGNCAGTVQGKFTGTVSMDCANDLAGAKLAASRLASSASQRRILRQLADMEKKMTGTATIGDISALLSVESQKWQRIAASRSRYCGDLVKAITEMSPDATVSALLAESLKKCYDEGRNMFGYNGPATKLIALGNQGGVFETATGRAVVFSPDPAVAEAKARVAEAKAASAKAFARAESENALAKSVGASARVKASSSKTGWIVLGVVAGVALVAAGVVTAIVVSKNHDTEVVNDFGSQTQAMTAVPPGGIRF